MDSQQRLSLGQIAHDERERGFDPSGAVRYMAAERPSLPVVPLGLPVLLALLLLPSRSSLSSETAPRSVLIVRAAVDFGDARASRMPPKPW
jgi:hypothetical protein